MKTEETAVKQQVATVEEISARFSEQHIREGRGFVQQFRYFCPKCSRTHHIFGFGPSSKAKVAICGTSFPIFPWE